MAIKKYLFREEEDLFDKVEQIREKLNIRTTKDALVMIINSGVAAICMHHGINIRSKADEIITIPDPPPSGFKLMDEAEIKEEEVTVEEE